MIQAERINQVYNTSNIAIEYTSKYLMEVRKSVATLQESEKQAYYYKPMARVMELFTHFSSKKKDFAAEKEQRASWVFGLVDGLSVEEVQNYIGKLE